MLPAAVIIRNWTGLLAIKNAIMSTACHVVTTDNLSHDSKEITQVRHPSSPSELIRSRSCFTQAGGELLPIARWGMQCDDVAAV